MSLSIPLQSGHGRRVGCSGDVVAEDLGWFFLRVSVVADLFDSTSDLSFCSVREKASMALNASNTAGNINHRQLGRVLWGREEFQPTGSSGTIGYGSRYLGDERFTALAKLPDVDQS